ncbi:hypothetical protein I3842_03G183700 [Carya illinoinensis]|uniref:Uncharacterized protein n=1 Tax=Carya illinoinensis TaxID=32201 RepID=A0A922FLE1_CARIL|nr:hypothetical protein I3842_03G183700 [Carya illinoinensis]
MNSIIRKTIKSMVRTTFTTSNKQFLIIFLHPIIFPLGIATNIFRNVYQGDLLPSQDKSLGLPPMHAADLSLSLCSSYILLEHASSSSQVRSPWNSKSLSHTLHMLDKCQTWPFLSKVACKP